MLEIYLAGTGGMKPLPDRALTGMWAEHEGSALLIDCGEGMQTALAKCGRSLARLDMLLFTHFHADHIAGLPGLLLSAGNFGKTSPLRIYAPEGGGEIVRKLCCICPELPFELTVTELEKNGGAFMWNDIIVEAMPVRHRTECFCYSLTERRKPVFSPDKAKALNVPIEMWKRLHSGENVLSGGRLITPDMVTDGVRAPLKVSYITDTVYFDDLADFACDSDLIICEGMYGDDGYIGKMREKGHMVFSQAAKVAARSGSKELWLTHYSPALALPEDYSDMMRSLFPQSVIGRDGMHKTVK